MTDVYRTEGNPFASAIDEVRRATAARDVVREAAWQAGLAEARIALRNFSEAVAPVRVLLRRPDYRDGLRDIDLVVARGDRVTICVSCPRILVWRRVIEVVWDAAAGQWRAFDEGPGGTFADILLRATRAPNFGEILAAVTPRNAVREKPSTITADADAIALAVVAHPPALEPMPEPPWYARRVVHAAAGCAAIVAVLLATC